ncbi:MAG TPA: hypothetical protein VK403_03585 [Allosphingosinicella sp.]|nr:hypothetical protein [Allosphingosinicella sp.]
MAMSELPRAKAASETCLAEAGYAEAERAARLDAENAFVRNHESTLDRLKYRR